MTKKNNSKKEVYGRALRGRLQYVSDTRGRKGIDNIFKNMIKKGYHGPTHMSDFEADNVYPFEHHILLLKSFRELYGEKEFDRMSRKTPMIKDVMGWYVKFFKKPDVLIESVGDYWDKFFAFGDIEGQMIGKNEGLLRGQGICSETPLFCRSLTGYFVGVCNAIKLNASCKHTQCELNGSEISEWRLRW